MLIAGHDTSTALLAWTFALLGQHPDVHERVSRSRHAGKNRPCSTRSSRKACACIRPSTSATAAWRKRWNSPRAASLRASGCSTPSISPTATRRSGRTPSRFLSRTFRTWTQDAAVLLRAVWRRSAGVYRRGVRSGGGADRHGAVAADTHLRIYESQDPCPHGRDARAAARGDDESKKRQAFRRSKQSPTTRGVCFVGNERLEKENDLLRLSTSLSYSSPFWLPCHRVLGQGRANRSRLPQWARGVDRDRPSTC
jgi:hypothetical protein